MIISLYLVGSSMIDYNTPTFFSDGYDDGAGDVTKVEHYLQQALDNISCIFDVRRQLQLFVQKY